MTNDRPDPSSERAPDWQTRNCLTVRNIWSWAPDGARHQDWLTGWPSVVTRLWLWLLVLLFCTEYGSSTFLRNVGKLPDYTASRLRTLHRLRCDKLRRIRTPLPLLARGCCEVWYRCRSCLSVWLALHCPSAWRVRGSNLWLVSIENSVFHSKVYIDTEYWVSKHKQTSPLDSSYADGVH
jgi:hypothetical protein